MIELVSGAIAYKADNWAGDGKKWTGYTFLAFAILLPALPLMASLNAWGLLLIPYAVFCALAMRKWGVWGELFVNLNRDPWPKHKWFRQLVSGVYGRKYNELDDEDLKQWKVLGWGVRYAFYCLPIAVLYSWCNFITGDYLNMITPFLMLPIAGLVRGCVYWYGLSHKNLAWCEMWGGAFAMLVLVGSV